MQNFLQKLVAFSRGLYDSPRSSNDAGHPFQASAGQSLFPSAYLIPLQETVGWMPLTQKVNC
jgi:hypothetical protein